MTSDRQTGEWLLTSRNPIQGELRNYNYKQMKKGHIKILHSLIIIRTLK
jgi:hypothetical protein